MEYNKDVPIEACLRQVMKENTELKAKVRELNREVEWRDRAIADFKIWQGKVFQQNVSSWIEAALSFMDNPQDKAEMKLAKSFLSKYENYRQFLDTINEKYEEVQENIERLRKFRDRINK